TSTRRPSTHARPRLAYPARATSRSPTRATSRRSRTQALSATRWSSSSALRSGDPGTHERDEACPSLAQRGLVELARRTFVTADRGADQAVPVGRQRVERPLR